MLGSSGSRTGLRRGKVIVPADRPQPITWAGPREVMSRISGSKVRAICRKVCESVSVCLCMWKGWNLFRSPLKFSYSQEKQDGLNSFSIFVFFFLFYYWKKKESCVFVSSLGMLQWLKTRIMWLFTRGCVVYDFLYTVTLFIKLPNIINPNKFIHKMNPAHIILTMKPLKFNSSILPFGSLQVK